MSAILHIVGRLGRDPETRTVNDNPVCGFTVAVDRKVKGEKITDWFRCQVWGRQADVAQRYLAKGRQVAVHGRFSPREFEGQNGKQLSLEIDVIGFDLIGGREDGGGNGGGYQPEPKPAAGRKPIDLDDEIPF